MLGTSTYVSGVWYQVKGPRLHFDMSLSYWKLGRLYILSIAPITDSVRLLVPECKRVSCTELALP